MHQRIIFSFIAVIMIISVMSIFYINVSSPGGIPLDLDKKIMIRVC